MAEKLYHIHLSKDDLEGARYAILPGDPGRVEKIAAFLDNPKPLGCNREYNSWLGELNGKKVVVVSTGIGGPSAAICIEELNQLGVDTFLRIGTCGGMQMEVLAGDVVIVNGAIRQEGTSKEYLPIEYPAVADFDVTLALKRAAAELKIPNHTGIVQCKDSFYGQHSPERMPVSYELLDKWQAWIKGGALASEMETAALFTIAATLRARAGAAMLCVWNQERVAKGLSNDEQHDTEAAIRVVVEGVRKLIEEDNA